MGIGRSSSTSTIFAKLVSPLLCFIIILAILYVGREILAPLAFSFLIGLLLIGPCRFFEKQGFPRSVSALISMLLASIVFLVVFYLISNSLVSFKKDLPLMIQNIETSLKQLEVWAQKTFNISRESAKDIVQSSTDEVVPSTSAIINTTVTTVTNLFAVGILIFITSFLILLYRRLFVLFFINLFADDYIPAIHSALSKIEFVIRSYIAGLLIEMIIIAIAYCSVFFLLGVKYALLLGVIGAVLNIIPYLGVIMTCVLSALITITTNTPTTVVWLVASIIIIHMIDTNILMPRIMAAKVQINALAAIIGVFTGTALWGLPGTFMAMPIMAAMKVVFEEIEPLRPFAILMGDDTEVKSFSGPVIRRIARSVNRKKTKK